MRTGEPIGIAPVCVLPDMPDTPQPSCGNPARDRPDTSRPRRSARFALIYRWYDAFRWYLNYRQTVRGPTELSGRSTGPASGALASNGCRKRVFNPLQWLSTCLTM